MKQHVMKKDSAMTLHKAKGQIKPKADWRTVDSTKKYFFCFFAFLLFKANKTNSFVCFLEESTVRPNCFWFYLTFNNFNKSVHSMGQYFTKTVAK